MRTIAIGDIHGCVLALEAILESIQPQPDDRLVFLGDYVDRGPDSRGVIELVMATAYRCRIVPLLGNHELMLVAARESPQFVPFWLQCGGQQTIDSYGGDLAQVPTEHWDFFESCRRHFETDSHLYFHANYDPTLMPAEQSDMLTLWQHLSQSIPGPHRSGKTAIVGHTPQRNGEVLDLGHLLCIDTACFAGGWLTAIDVHSKQLWQANRLGQLRPSAVCEPPQPRET